MAYEGKRRPLRELQPLAAHVKPYLEPVMQKKSGFDMALLDNWPQIVGERMAQICTPFKITWPRPPAGEKARPASLTIACEGLTSLKIQHQTEEILEKINVFFGFHAIGKVKIVQKSLSHQPDAPPHMRPLNQTETAWLEAQTCLLTDELLRSSMFRLGKNIMATTPCPKKSHI